MRRLSLIFPNSSLIAESLMSRDSRSLKLGEALITNRNPPSWLCIFKLPPLPPLEGMWSSKMPNFPFHASIGVMSSSLDCGSAGRAISCGLALVVGLAARALFLPPSCKDPQSLAEFPFGLGWSANSFVDCSQQSTNELPPSLVQNIGWHIQKLRFLNLIYEC